MTPSDSGAFAVRMVGVEEELMLVDPESGVLVPCGQEIVAGAGAASHGAPARGWGPVIKPEFFLEQVETATRPCTTLSDLDADVRAGRRLVRSAAETAGIAAVAMPTPVVEQPPGRVTPTSRYRGIRESYGGIARDSLICAMHIHVEVRDDHEGVAVLDRVRPWIPLLLALSANSPFWRGDVTGYDSWRWQVWRGWPSTGPAEPFGDAATYHTVTRQVLATGAAHDRALLNYEVRLSARYPTVEFRVADVCTDTEDAVVIAGLARALVATSVASWRRGEPIPSCRSDVLRSASWRAARSGLSGGLHDPTSGRMAGAADVATALLLSTREALETAGDLERVSAGVERLVATGNGAARQREVHARTHDLVAVVADLARRTSP